MVHLLGSNFVTVFDVSFETEGEVRGRAGNLGGNVGTDSNASFDFNLALRFARCVRNFLCTFFKRRVWCNDSSDRDGAGIKVSVNGKPSWDMMDGRRDGLVSFEMFMWLAFVNDIPLRNTPFAVEESEIRNKRMPPFFLLANSNPKGDL